MPTGVAAMRLLVCVGLSVLLLAFSHGPAFADCPANSSPKYEANNVVHCRCNCGYEPQGQMCIETKAHAASPSTYETSIAEQRKAVDARIVNLEKAIDLLGNPERFTTDLERIFEDVQEDAKGLSFELLNLVTVGLARGAKELPHFNVLVQKANAAKIASQLGQLADEDWRLQGVLGELRDPELVRLVLDKGALNNVRIAEQGAKTGEAYARTLEAAEALHSNYEYIKLNPPTHSISSALYASSAVVGSAAIIFVEGDAAIVAAAGSVAASIVIGGRELVNLWQEVAQLRAVYQDARRREQMKQELMVRLDSLRQQQAKLNIDGKRCAHSSGQPIRN